MASQKYFCFKCRDNGFPNEEITFAGKDAEGKTIYKNAADMSAHVHKQQQQQQQQQQSDKPIPKMILEILYTKLAEVSYKVDRLLNLAERK